MGCRCKSGALAILCIAVILKFAYKQNMAPYYKRGTGKPAELNGLPFSANFSESDRTQLHTYAVWRYTLYLDVRK